MKIYICTSTRNLEQYRALQAALALSPHMVLDWTPLLPPPGPDFEKRKDEDPGRYIFLFCSNACACADLIVYLGPSGQDAGTELGIAFTAGVPVWGIAGPDEKPGAMVKGCVCRWFPSIDDLALELTRWRGW